MLQIPFCYTSPEVPRFPDSFLLTQLWVARDDVSIYLPYGQGCWLFWIMLVCAIQAFQKASIGRLSDAYLEFYCLTCILWGDSNLAGGSHVCRAAALPVFSPLVGGLQSNKNGSVSRL